MSENSGQQLLVKARFNFQQTNEDELTFNKGDIISVSRQEEGGWWEGTLNGRTGWFPSNYVREVKGSGGYIHFSTLYMLILKLVIFIDPILLFIFLISLWYYLHFIIVIVIIRSVDDVDVCQLFLKQLRVTLKKVTLRLDLCLCSDILKLICAL